MIIVETDFKPHQFELERVQQKKAEIRRQLEENGIGELKVTLKNENTRANTVCSFRAMKV